MAVQNHARSRLSRRKVPCITSSMIHCAYRKHHPGRSSVGRADRHVTHCYIRPEPTVEESDGVFGRHNRFPALSTCFLRTSGESCEATGASLLAPKHMRGQCRLHGRPSLASLFDVGLLVVSRLSGRSGPYKLGLQLSCGPRETTK